MTTTRYTTRQFGITDWVCTCGEMGRGDALRAVHEINHIENDFWHDRVAFYSGLGASTAEAHSWADRDVEAQFH
jgi:hypothetical protein